MTGRVRIALYSHDTVGLGHVRRNLLIARALASTALEPAILMVAGTSQAAAFASPPGVDWVTLPALQKDAEGRYAAGPLPLSLRRLVSLRARTIHAALMAFDPDLLIVDKVPRGALGELDPTLAALKARGRSRCVLGLRDVLDEPIVVRREWAHAENEAAIRAFYSAIWVYGDRDVYDLAREYRFSADVSARLTYTGYLDPRIRLEASEGHPSTRQEPIALPDGRQILCTVGGGQDGGSILKAFARAALPEGAHGVVLTGPFLPGGTRQLVRRLAEGNDRLSVIDFVPEAAHLIQRADCVVTMGGYNTISEVLSFGKRALVVPRVSPRREQLIRAEQLRRLGLVDVLHPAGLSPTAISEWLSSEGAARARMTINLGGLARVPALAEELLASQVVPASSLAH